MKQSIPTPVAIVVALVVLGGLGFFLYRHYMVPASTGEQPINPGGSAKMSEPKSKEEAMKMYRGGH